jgi:hypothetical protein
MKAFAQNGYGTAEVYELVDALTRFREAQHVGKIVIRMPRA